MSTPPRRGRCCWPPCGTPTPGSATTRPARSARCATRGACRALAELGADGSRRCTCASPRSKRSARRTARAPPKCCCRIGRATSGRIWRPRRCAALGRVPGERRRDGARDRAAVGRHRRGALAAVAGLRAQATPQAVEALAWTAGADADADGRGARGGRAGRHRRSAPARPATPRSAPLVDAQRRSPGAATRAVTALAGLPYARIPIVAPACRTRSTMSGARRSRRWGRCAIPTRPPPSAPPSPTATPGCACRGHRARRTRRARARRAPSRSWRATTSRAPSRRAAADALARQGRRPSRRHAGNGWVSPAMASQSGNLGLSLAAVPLAARSDPRAHRPLLRCGARGHAGRSARARWSSSAGSPRSSTTTTC